MPRKKIYVLMVAAFLVVLFLSVDGLPRANDSPPGKQAYWDNVSFSLPDTLNVEKSSGWSGYGIGVETRDATANRTDIIFNQREVNRPVKKSKSDEGIIK